MHQSQRNCKPISTRHQHEHTPTEVTAVLRCCAIRVFLFPLIKANIVYANTVKRTMPECKRYLRLNSKILQVRAQKHGQITF